jgi:DNA-binding response OmpR family regulator
MANYTILVIDYEPRSIEKLRAPLERAGHHVEVATDGKAGIRAFHKLKPSAVIIEAMLPKRHGFEVCQELKQTPHGAICPVMIATSVYRGRKYRHQAMHLYACDAYLEKPITDEDLLRTVDTALEAYATMRRGAEEQDSVEIEIDTSNLGTEVPAEEPDAEPSAETVSPGAQPAAARASSGLVPTNLSMAKDDREFDILDRLDSLLSDDPSKSSPSGSGK